jgi:futalosine hydrolase
MNMEPKNILIVSATTVEIKELFENSSVHDAYLGNLVSGQYIDYSFDILITGPGMVPTAFYMGQWLGIKYYDLVINAGIAGSFNPGFQIGQVVNVVSDHFPELGAETDTQFIPLYKMQMARSIMPVFMNADGTIVNSEYPEIKTVSGLTKAKGITVNTISGNEQRITILKNRAGADIETMEGAAFFYACHAAGMPCIQIRSISNYIEPRNLQKWEIELASSNLVQTLKKILDEL